MCMPVCVYKVLINMVIIQSVGSSSTLNLLKTFCSSGGVCGKYAAQLIPVVNTLFCSLNNDRLTNLKMTNGANCLNKGRIMVCVLRCMTSK